MQKLSLRVIFITASLLLINSCGGGGSDDGSSQGSTPPPLNDDPNSPRAITETAAKMVGVSLDTALVQVGDVTGGSAILSNVVPDFARFWNDNTQQLVATTLTLGDNTSTTQDGNRVTVDPDESALCSEQSMRVVGNAAAFQRCLEVYQDLLVQIDKTSDTSGNISYLFKGQPVMLINYADNSSVFELNLAGLRSILDTEESIDSSIQSNGPYDSYSGVVRLSSTSSGTASIDGQSTVTIEVTQPISIRSSDAATSLTLESGKLIDISVNTADNSGRVAVDFGSLTASKKLDGDTVISYDLDALTAVIDIENNSEVLTFQNVSLGQSPLQVAVDDTEVFRLGVDSFGFTSKEQTGELVLNGQLSAEGFRKELLEDSTGINSALRNVLALFGDSFGMGFYAPADTAFSLGASYDLGDSIRVQAGGPFVGQYSPDSGDATNVTTNVGECFRQTIGVSFRGWGIESTNCNDADFDADTDGIADSSDNCPVNSNSDQADGDNDSVGDSCDNCAANSNSGQDDADGDGIGDACDPDSDGDGVNNLADNCPVTPNSTQTDVDSDGSGDACDATNDSDTDSDGVLDTADNCPTNANADQANQDGDSFGDACDDDRDGDTVNNTTDNCPTNPNADQADQDGDGIGDVCDNADDSDSDNDTILDTADNCQAIPNGDQANQDGDSFGDVCDDDRDGDTVLNTADNCPVNSNTDQADQDNDGIGDVCDNADDSDSDNDTILDINDNCPAIPNGDQANQDGDNFGDACDDDRDGDTILNTADNCPVNANTDQSDVDNDGIGDACDNANSSDSDNDTILDTNDNCPAIPNGDQANLDGDSFGDVCDDDRDGDTILNTADNCPINANPNQADSDNDGIGDVCDSTDNSDSDNDTILDTADNCPAIPNTDQANLDGDSLGDACDDDRDGDTILNTADNCPVNANTNQADSDNDGIGDVCDSTDNSDSDNDTILDTADNCPAIPNTDQANLDGDSFGDVCDDDMDGDTILNTADNCPVDSNQNQFDVDEDGIGNSCDTINPFWNRGSPFDFRWICQSSTDGSVVRADGNMILEDHFTGPYQSGEFDGATATVRITSVPGTVATDPDFGINGTPVGQQSTTVANGAIAFSVPVTTPFLYQASDISYYWNLTLDGVAIKSKFRNVRAISNNTLCNTVDGGLYRVR